MNRRCALFVVSACLMSILAQGCIYSRVQRPFDENFDQTTLGSKVGRAHFHSVLWLFAWGDAGTKAAAENGGIAIIRHADAEYMIILFGLYARSTTIVYGD